MEQEETSKIYLLPHTKPGKFAYGLGIFTLAILLLALINSGLAKPMAENLLGFVVFIGICAALIALIVGLISIIKHKERSIVVFLMSAVGLAAFVWVFVMIIKDIVK